MKKALILSIIFLFSCNPNKEKTKELKHKIIKSNLYDLYYLELLEKNKNFNPINIDSLKTKNIKETLLNQVIVYSSIDSVSLKNMKEKVRLDNSVIEIQVTDSIKRKIRSKERKLEIMDSFSKPIWISNSQKLILFETAHRYGRSDGAVFFSESSKGLWRLDSTVVLNNYRGGGKFFK